MEITPQTTSLRALATSMSAGAAVYHLTSGEKQHVITSNLVGGDMLILHTKTASGSNHMHVVTDSESSVIPAVFGRLFAALRRASKTSFGVYIHEALQKEGAPIDPGVDWDALLMSVYRKFRWTQDDALLEDAIYNMLTNLLYVKSTTLLKKFKPEAANERLPLEKQYTRFLMNYLLPSQGKMSAGADMVRGYLKRYSRDISESQLEGEDAGTFHHQVDPNELDPDQVSLREEDTPPVVLSLRKAFSDFLHRNYHRTGVNRILTLFDIYVQNPYKDSDSMAETLDEWEKQTGTGKANFYQARRLLTQAFSDFAQGPHQPFGSKLLSWVQQAVAPEYRKS